MDPMDVESRSAEKEEGVKVCIRVRPLNGGHSEDDEISANGWTTTEDTISYTSGGVSFNFDNVFTPPCRNQDLYDSVASSIIKSAVDGFNGVIFAYGQTSSGKTHTMLGNEGDSGITPLAIQDVFRHVLKSTEREFLVRVSYIEIYNEVIKDLLCKGQDNLKIHEDFTGRVFVDAREEVVTCAADVLAIMKLGEEQRTFGATNMNERSSRSHTIFTIHIESRTKGEHTNADDGVAVCASTLSLVDLAGSERVSHTGAEGVRLKEGGHINKSLLTLGTVINKLSEGVTGHIPYRDSKLTRILQPALGGNARTGVICAITPAKMHMEESISTLKFASRAKCVQNKTSRIEILDDRAMLRRCQKELEQLKQKLEQRGCDSALKDSREVEELRHRMEKEVEKALDLQNKVDKLSQMLVFKKDEPLSPEPGEKRPRSRRRETIGCRANELGQASRRDENSHFERIGMLTKEVVTVKKEAVDAIKEKETMRRHMEVQREALRNELEALEMHAAELERTRKLASSEAETAGERVAAAEVLIFVEEIVTNAMLTSEQSRRDSVRKSLGEVKEERSRIQKDLDSAMKRERIGTGPLQKQVDQMKNKITELEAKLKAAKSTTSRLESEKLQHEKESKSMEKQIRGMEVIKSKEIEKALRESERVKENELRGKTLQIDALGQEIERSRLERAKVEAELKSLKESQNSLQQDLQQKEIEIEESGAKIEALKSQATKESEKHEEEKKATLQKIEDLKSKLKNQVEASELQEKELNEALEEEVEEVRIAWEKSEALTSELQTLKNSLARSSEDNENLQKARDDAIAELDKVRAELEVAKSAAIEQEKGMQADADKRVLCAVESLEEELRAEKHSQAQLKADNARLLTDLGAEAENLKKVISERENEVITLTDNFQRMRDEFDLYKYTAEQDHADALQKYTARNGVLEDEKMKLIEENRVLDETCSTLRSEVADNAHEKVRLLDRYQNIEQQKRKLELGLESWTNGEGRVGTLERKLQRREIKVKKLELQLKRMEERMVLEGKAREFLDAKERSELETRAQAAEKDAGLHMDRFEKLDSQRLALLTETHKLRDEISLRDKAYAELEARQLAADASIADMKKMQPRPIAAEQSITGVENVYKSVGKPPRCPPSKRAPLREVQGVADI